MNRDLVIPLLRMSALILVLALQSTQLFAQATDTAIKQIVDESIAKYRAGDLPGALLALERGVKLAPQDPTVHGVLVQLYALTGSYEAAQQTYEKYEALGGPKGVATQYAIAAQAILRQLGGKNVPPADWLPKEFANDLTMRGAASPCPTPFLLDASATQMADPNAVLGGKRATKNYFVIANRYRIEGSESSPCAYGPGLYIWNATVIYDHVNDYGLLLADGTRVKYVRVVNGNTIERIGVVKGWVITFQEK